MNNNKIDSIPYVLFINDKGEGFTLNRGYKLLHPNIGGFGGLNRQCLKQLIPLAIQEREDYTLTDEEAIPAWCMQRRRVKWEIQHSLKGKWTTYWFNQEDEAVQQAFFTPKIDKGVTYHFDKFGDINHEIKSRKAQMRDEITQQYRKEFHIKKPFFLGGGVRVYATWTQHTEDGLMDEFCADWNDRWVEYDKLTLKELKANIAELIERKGRDYPTLTGQVLISIEGTYSAATSFEEAQNHEYEPWGDHWLVDNLATISF